jgi:mercuric reductase
MELAMATRASTTMPDTAAATDPVAIVVRPGVTLPDWSVVVSETARKALTAVFEICDWETRWAGFDDAQDRMRRAILDAYRQAGRAPSTAELARATGLAPDRVRDLLAKLAARDMVVLDQDDATLTGAYPFTDGNTEHRLRLGDIVLHAMCAVDALGAGAMLGTDVAIESSCRSCGAPIHIETRDNGQALAPPAPAGAVVWSGIQYANGRAADSLCRAVAFFCTDRHLEAWRDAQDPAPNGFRLSLDEGLQIGKAVFMPLMANAD